jgi:O-acetyl-ADP-ribose deacetylase (regulator of RNase III)
MTNIRVQDGLGGAGKANNVFNGRIGNTSVQVSLGDMTQVKADAYLVPEFDSCVSLGGVGGAVYRGGAVSGMNAYENHLKSNGGSQPFGAAIVTPSGGGNSKHLIHVVSVGSDRQEEFKTVQTSVYNALKAAAGKGIKTVVAPALGTGIIGQLTSEQSAQAMLSGIQKFAVEVGDQNQVQIVIYGDKRAQETFGRVLSSGTFSHAVAEFQIGQKEFDPEEWIRSMHADVNANKKFEAEQN